MKVFLAVVLVALFVLLITIPDSDGLVQNSLIRTGRSRFRPMQKNVAPTGTDDITLSGSIEEKPGRSDAEFQSQEPLGCGNGRCFFGWFDSWYDHPPLEYCEEVYDTYTGLYHEICTPV